MRKFYTLLVREVRGYFHSPIAYVVLVFFLLVAGVDFYFQVSFMNQRPASYSVQEAFFNSVFFWFAFVLIFPLITMRLFAEEKRTGTIELLITSPVRDLEIILGKWLAALVLYLCIIGIAALNISILFAFGHPDWKPILVGFFGLLLQGGCLLAIGIFISTMTKNQIIAGGATFAVCLMLWVLDWVSAYDQSAWAKVIAYLSVVTHFDPFSKGVLDSKDIVFYCSMIFFGLFLTARSVESLRWRA